jgi:DNA-binding transcriptional ArsR family regulator
MGKVDSFREEDGRLPSRLAVALDRKLQDALDHPIRREVLRTLHRNVRSCTVAEIRAELRAFQLSQLSYHLQVLRRSGTVASDQGSVGASPAPAHYASEVADDGTVRAALRATQKGDEERREAAVVAKASPLLTMFRVPRPVRAIRLRGQSKIDAERER